MPIIDPIAVAVSLIGVWLATRRSLLHYPFAFASVTLYAWIFFSVKLYADVALQGVFAATLAYGARLKYSYRRSTRSRMETRT